MSDDRPIGDGDQQPSYPQYPGYPGDAGGAGWPLPPQQPDPTQAPGAGQVPPYSPPPGYHVPAHGYPQWAPQRHPSATTAMVLGIVALAGGLLCYLPVVIAPFAWWQGHKVMREIDASGGRFSGRGEAKAGFVLGIIGTVLLLMMLAFAALLITLTITVDDFWVGR